MRRRAKAPESGFALLEALSALAIASLVVLTIAIAAGLLVRSWERAAARAHSLEIVSTGLEALRKDLTAAIPARWGDDQDGGVLFRGTPDSVLLATSRELNGTGRGISLVSIRAVQDRETAALVRSSAPLLPNTRLSARMGNSAEMMSGPWRFRFSYKGRPGDTAEDDETHRARQDEWHDFWTEETVIPSAIRVAILDPDSGQSIVPPLVVTPPVNAEPGCVEGSADHCSFARDSDGDEEMDSEEVDMDPSAGTESASETEGELR